MLVSPADAGAANMALDHALLRRAAASGEAVLRVYSWRVPTLSLGRNQPARGVYSAPALRRFGVEMVRRPTGGRAVLHHREITYSVTAPTGGDGPEGPRIRSRDLYAAINRLLVGALQALGVPALTAVSPVAALPDGDRSHTAAWPGPSAVPCFDVATEGEVVAMGRKLAGSAQWREGRAVLQHGSILIEDDQWMLGTLGPGAAPAPVATLRELLGHAPTVDDVAAALRRTLDDALRQNGAPLSADFEADADIRASADALRAHYADDAWTWRR